MFKIFQFIALLSTIALANAGLLQEPVALQYTHDIHNDYSHGVQSQDILRTHGGTVSHIQKSVVSPHSSVSKSVKTVTNEGYKTLSYAAPSYHHYEPAQQVHYSAPQVHYSAPHVQYAPQVQYAAAPVQYSTYAHHHEPTYVKSYQPATVVKSVEPAYYASKPVVHAQPLLKTYAQPALVKSYETAYHHHEPQHVQYAAAPVVHHQPLVKTVQPVVEAHSTKTLSYSPASAVSHFTFESPVAHYAW